MPDQWWGEAPERSAMFTTPRMILNRSRSNAEPRAEPLVPRRVITDRDAGLKIPTFRLQAGGKLSAGPRLGGLIVLAHGGSG